MTTLKIVYGIHESQMKKTSEVSAFQISLLKCSQAGRKDITHYFTKLLAYKD